MSARVIGVIVLGLLAVSMFAGLIMLKHRYDDGIVTATKDNITSDAIETEHGELLKDETIKRNVRNFTPKQLDDELRKDCRDCDGEPVERMPSQGPYPDIKKGRVVGGDKSSNSDAESDSPSSMFGSGKEDQSEDPEVTPFCTPDDIIFNRNDCGTYNGF